MTWKLRLINRYNFTAVIIEVEANTKEQAKAIYEKDWSRFQYLDKIEMAATKKQIIDSILTDMKEKQGPNDDAEKRFGGFLRRQNKAQLEAILEARMSY